MSSPSQTSSQSAQQRAVKDAGAETSHSRVMFRLEESRLPRGKIGEDAKVSKFGIGLVIELGQFGLV